MHNRTPEPPAEGWQRRRRHVRRLPSFPNCHSSFVNSQSGERNPARAGRTKSMLRMVEIQPVAGRNLQASPADDEAPKPFRFRGFIYPGSYLLSRDLSSDYHRRADVSLPGSEWDRVGPSGYDHQVSGSCASASYSLLTSVIICACGLLCWCCCGGGRLASAWLVLCAFGLCSSLTLGYI